MSAPVLRELQQLKEVLEGRGSPTTLQKGERLGPTLEAAETSLETLRRIMAAGEDDVEEAIRGTAQLNSASAAGLEQEVLDLRRTLAARERSLDSLRATLASTKHHLERQLGEAQEQVAGQCVQLQQLQEALEECGQERDLLLRRIEAHAKEAQTLQEQLQASWTEAETGQKAELEGAHTRIDALEHELARSQGDLLDSRQQVHELTVQCQALQQALDDKERLITQMRRKAGSYSQALRQLQERQAAQQESAGTQDRKLHDARATISQLQDQLNTQLEHNKKLCKFLKAELVSKAELEKLILSAQQLMQTGLRKSEGAAMHHGQSSEAEHRGMGPGRAEGDADSDACSFCSTTSHPDEAIKAGAQSVAVDSPDSRQQKNFTAVPPLAGRLDQELISFRRYLMERMGRHSIA